MKKRNPGLGYKESKDMKTMPLFPSSVTNEFQAAALKSKVDGPTQAPGRPSILPETRIGSLFGLICNIIY